jgi:hypothetical protein
VDSRSTSVEQPPIPTCHKVMTKRFKQPIQRSGEILEIAVAVVVSYEDQTLPESIMLHTIHWTAARHPSSSHLSPPVMSVKILSSAHPWLDRQRSSSVLFGGLLPLVSAAISCRCSLFGSLAYVSVRRRFRVAAALVYSLPEDLCSTSAISYRSRPSRLRSSRLPLVTVLCSSRLQPPGGLM